MNYNISGVTHKFISVNGTRLHVAEVGKGKPLLLIHGWPQHWYEWRKLIPLLSERYKLIMPDLPGFGWSDPPKDSNYRKEQLAAEMIALLDALKLKQVGLVGHDWGGWIGFLMCLQNPKRFSHYLALGITSPLTKLKVSPVEYRRFLYQIPLSFPLLGEFLLRNFPSLIDWSLKKCTYQKEIWTKEEVQIYSHIIQQPANAHASSLLYRMFLTKEYFPLLRGKYRDQRLRVPTHLLIGADDPVIHPSLFKNFQNGTNNMTYEILPNCGHFIPEEQPEFVARKIKQLF